MIRSPNVIIFSVDKGDENDKHNRLYCESLLDAAEATYSIAEGCYKGKTEQSYVVVSPSDAVSDLINKFAGRCKQESILLVDSNRHASLLYLDNGKTVGLGRLTEVTESEAKQCDAYTLSNGRYYITKEY